MVRFCRFIKVSEEIFDATGFLRSQDEEHYLYAAKLSGFKSVRIQSSHFRFRIQNLRRHDQTGMFLFRICPPVCKWQSQSGTKTFRIHRESGTISSNVNLVSGI